MKTLHDLELQRDLATDLKSITYSSGRLGLEPLDVLTPLELLVARCCILQVLSVVACIHHTHNVEGKCFIARIIREEWVSDGYIIVDKTTLVHKWQLLDLRNTK